MSASLDHEARKEQRKSPRRPVAVRCCLGDGVVERYARLADVSAGGARVVTAGPPAPGTRVRLTFQLNELDPSIETLARVVWCTQGYRGRGGVMGVVFESVSLPEVLAAYAAGA